MWHGWHLQCILWHGYGRLKSRMKYFNSQRMAHEHEGEERLINRALHEDNHYGVEDDIRDPSLVDLQQVCLKINLCVDVATCYMPHCFFGSCNFYTYKVHCLKHRCLDGHWRVVGCQSHVVGYRRAAGMVSMVACGLDISNMGSFGTNNVPLYVPIEDQGLRASSSFLKPICKKKIKCIKFFFSCRERWCNCNGVHGGMWIRYIQHG